ncbi:HNH endonuclease [Fulvivirgaceae bacterium BMA10]|uniref:HNH endonuclease n=1 Tax=Splendidivirga corallicola TaxID=3051826 RepID=A0ABT8KG99_9BACT|nr:HNH endonuclease [Fulvivirgaceae bacterium BMA10]
MEKNDLKNERWKEVNFNTKLTHPKYEVSNLGRVRSYALDPDKGKIIRGGNVNGYRSISVRFDKKISRQFYVHRLVAETFLKKDGTDQHFVIHLDYNKENNSIYNLKWATEKELTSHNNKNPQVLKRRVTGYKLTEPDVRIIKKLLKSDKTRLSMIAKRFGITHTQLNRIRSGENWGHVE